MKSPRTICLFFLLLLPGAALPVVAAEEAEEPGIEIEAIKPGEIRYNYETGIAIATNDFVVRYKGAVLTAQRGQLNEKAGEVAAEGAVNLQDGNQVWRGERLQYNFLTRQIHT